MQGKGFRDRIQNLSEHATILGASFDTVEENRAFAQKFDFPFRLLCDTTRALGLAYGAAVDADATYPARITYLIDAEGKIEWATEVQDIDAHVDEAIRRLTAEDG